jgi:hypothetical protein
MELRVLSDSEVEKLFELLGYAAYERVVITTEEALAEAGATAADAYRLIDSLPEGGVEFTLSLAFGLTPGDDFIELIRNDEA